MTSHTVYAISNVAVFFSFIVIALMIRRLRRSLGSALPRVANLALILMKVLVLVLGLQRLVDVFTLHLPIDGLRAGFSVASAILAIAAASCHIIGEPTAARALRFYATRNEESDS